jgi:hypothetical protein
MAKHNLLISITFLALFSTFATSTLPVLQSETNNTHTRPFTPYQPLRQSQTLKHKFEDTAEDAPSLEEDEEPPEEDETQSTSQNRRATADLR